MLGMQPEARERLASDGFRLRDFVFVMRKNQIDPAGVNVERFAQIAHRHGGTFDVPAGTAVTERRLPEGSFPLRAFQSTKSRASALSYSSTSTRAPARIPLKSLCESLPYSGKLAMRK